MTPEDADFQAWLGHFASSLDNASNMDVEPAVLNMLADGKLFGHPASLPPWPGGSNAPPALSMLGAPEAVQAQIQVQPAAPAPLQQQQASQVIQQQQASQVKQTRVGKLSTAELECSRRFRQRRKEKVSAMEEEVRAKAAQLAQLQAHNTELTAKRAALEAMVGATDHNMQIISSRIAGLQVSDSPCEACTSTSDCTQSANDSSSDKSNKGGMLISAIRSSSSGHLTQVGPGTSAPDGRIEAAQQIAGLADAQAAVRHAVAQLSSLLLQLEDQPWDAADVEQHIHAIITEVSGSIMPWAVGNPLRISHLENSNLATGELLTAQTRPGKEHWGRVAGCITLGDHTLRLMGAAHRIYQDKLGPVMAERQRLLDQISQLGGAEAVETVASDDSGHQATHGPPTDASVLRQSYEELLKRLQRTYMRAHFLEASFMSCCTKTFLSTTQLAKLMVHSYPYMPDVERVLLLLLRSDRQSPGSTGPS